MSSIATSQLELRDVSHDARLSEYWTKRYESHKQSYLRRTVPMRLGELASALGHVRAATEPPLNETTARHFIEASLFYIEWTQAETNAALQSELDLLRQQLIEWLQTWPLAWNDAVKRSGLATSANVWAQKIVAHSGLLDPNNPYAR